MKRFSYQKLHLNGIIMSFSFYEVLSMKHYMSMAYWCNKKQVCCKSQNKEDLEFQDRQFLNRNTKVIMEKWTRMVSSTADLLF